jgi:hypothetical protein
MAQAAEVVAVVLVVHFPPVEEQDLAHIAESLLATHKLLQVGV